MKGTFIGLGAAVILLLIASASGQEPVIEDAAGDVQIGSQGNFQPVPAGYAAADFVALYVEETESSFLWTVEVAGAPSESNSCIDQGDLRSWFRYGTIEYNVQQGQTSITPFGGGAGCQPYAMLFETYGSDFARTFVAQLNITVEGNRFTAEIPRELIVDQTGAPPIAGREFTNIRARSFSHYSFGGPDVSDPFSQEQSDLLVINDNMPDTAVDQPDGGSFRIATGGMRHEGDLRVWSEYPFRASNGGNGIFAYDVIMENLGDAAQTVSLSLIGTPTDWKTSAVQTMALGPGERMVHTVAVETPFGHQHGGTDDFRVRVEGIDVDVPNGQWAEADLGIHYLEIPQPAGHHPTLFLHPQPWGQFNPFTSIFAGGDGDVWMHASSDPPGEDGATGPVQGFSQFPTDSRVLWPVCLTTDLKLGLDFDLTRAGHFIGKFTATKPYPGATLGGVLYHVSAGPSFQFCYEDFLTGRTLTEIARIDDVSLGDLQGTVAVETTVTPLVDEVPLEQGSTLMMYIWIDHGAVATPGGSQLTMDPGASATFPLLEYLTDAPVGLIGGEAAVADVGDVDEEIFDEQVADESNDSPTGVVFFAAALGAALILRRR